ncbi:hypothetical protein IGI04_001122, partial [Brassica rapa subsp. trilocularis]
PSLLQLIQSVNTSLKKLTKPDKDQKRYTSFFVSETSNTRNKQINMRDLALCLILFFLAKRVSSVPTKEQFENCLSTISKNPRNLTNYTSDSRIITASSNSPSPDSSFLNLNFTSLKPILTLKPKFEPEIKKAILCSKKLGVQVRTLSGGHDYEGLSYLSLTPFIIINLVNLQSMNKLVHRWQYIGAEVDEDLFIRVIIDNTKGVGQRRVQTAFQALFLGGVDRLIPLMNQKFPELGLQAQDCKEMSWIESVMFFIWKSGQPLETLVNRDLRYEDLYIKAKSDFVQKPIPENVFEEVTKRFLEKETPLMILEPLGGKINEISESESPYPHRRGNIYNIQYMVKWRVNTVEEMNKHVTWMRMLYDYMTPYVSASPRGAYLNYRDLDLGNNTGSKTSFEDARIWGEKYYRGNFKKLGLVKGKIDPTNFFRNEQSIPPLF